MAQTYFVATVTQTPHPEAFGTQIHHVWGHSLAWFKAGAQVYVTKRPAWTEPDGTTYPARYFVLHYTEGCVAVDEADAIHWLRCHRQHGHAVEDRSGQGAQIATRIGLHLNR